MINVFLLLIFIIPPKVWAWDVVCKSHGRNGNCTRSVRIATDQEINGVNGQIGSINNQIKKTEEKMLELNEKLKEFTEFLEKKVPQIDFEMERKLAKNRLPQIYQRALKIVLRELNLLKRLDEVVNDKGEIKCRR